MRKKALITGASGGIGYEFAKVLAKNHNDVILISRNKGKLQKVKKEFAQYKVDVRIIQKDLSKPNAAKQIFESVNKVDILVNNAGFGVYGDFTRTAWEKEAQMLQLNVVALTQLTKLFVKDMVKRRNGKIVNVASTAAFQPGPLMAVYYATKSYVLSFSEAVANEVEGTGVTVTTLCPGPTTSGFQKAAAMSNSNLVKGRNLPSAKEVAEYGYRAMQKGKTVAVHGVLNQFVASSVRFLPRKFVTMVVRKMQETR